MVVPGRRRSVAFFIALSACIIALTVALNISWVLQHWRNGVLLVLGVLFFMVIITGVVLNTIFLVREIRRNEQHDAFINAVTHELKTPVASIRLYLETLQSRSLDDAKRHQFYDIMLADSERLLHTIEQVLRAGSRKRELHRVPVDIRQIARECLDLARTRHHLAPEVMQFHDGLDTSPATVMGDVDELKAAISNLLENAIKYSGGEVSVQLSLASAGERQIAVRVSDRGVGIPNAELKRLFRRFYRIPGVMGGRVKGTGLGLFIVRSVAERHGGRAFAESEGMGRGSTFTLQLPAAAAR